MASQIITLLSNSLNPSLLQTSQREIERSRGNQGFATQLMIIADDNTHDIKIRQFALIVLKNMVYDQCNKGGAINSNDYEIVKGSILDALARQWGNKHLTPTLREIIHLIAEMDYPDRWPDILPIILNNISTSGDFNIVSSSVEALKAITTVCGKSIQKQVTLNNLCNKMVIPLFELANKLFANYSSQTQAILVSIFKIFNLAMFYHLPNIIMNNIHSLMIFCKKILDISAADMTPLKVACLKIQSRLYSRHTGSTIGYKLLKFAEDFHQRYSVPMVQTFIKQLMDTNNNEEIINLSLNCLTCIYKNYEKSAVLIDKYYLKILQLCLARYKVGKSIKQGQSVGSFITHLKEQRSHLIDFITVLFRCNDKILGDLIQYLTRGDEGTKELVLYIFGALSEEIQGCHQLYQSMSQFIINYILPILSGNSSSVMKARGCEIIAAYKYVQLPGQNLQTIFQFVYSCLTQSKDSYLNIYALEAFTQLICKYDNFLQIIIPYLQNILKVYTNLMKQSSGEVYEVIKSFELFLGHINGKDLENYAFDLVKFLTEVFYEHADQNNQNKINDQDENSEDDLEDEDQDDENLCGARQGCLACIREILSTDNLPKNLYPIIINDCILPLSVSLLSDSELVHFEECLNILNLCIYKSEELPKGFEQFFKIFVYAIIGLPQQLGSVNLQNQYKQILQNVCVNPDEDIVSNVVGFFRNFIAKCRNNLRDIKDEIGVSFLSYLYQIVEHAQVAKNDKGDFKYKKSERCVILTVYISLLQYEFLQPNEFSLVVNNVLNWYTGLQNQNFSQNNIYIEVLLVCLYYNAELTQEKLNIQWFIQELLKRQSLFKYEYQLQRFILGICKLIEKQMLKNQQSATQLINYLPNLVFRLGTQRAKEEAENTQQNSQKTYQEEIDLEEEAEEDLIAENTHMGLLPNKSQDRLKQEELNAFEEAEWDQEYNKFYFSPFININELEYLTNVLKNSPYTNLLPSQEQEKLSQYICNAPSKKIDN